MKTSRHLLPHSQQLSGLICLWLLAGCTSTDPTMGTTQVAGQVVQRQSRKPVGNGIVQVYLSSSAGGYRPVGASQACDAQGRFSFNFDAQKTGGYLLLAQAPPGYRTDWADAPELTAGRRNAGLVVPVLAPAWVRLVLVDEPPKSRASIHIQGYEGSGQTLVYPRDTILIRPLLADFKTRMYWFITEQGQQRNLHQDIQPAALDTVTVRIAF